MPFSRILGVGFRAAALAPAAVALPVLGLLLSGCYLFETQVIKPLPSLKGKTTESIERPRSLAFWNGKLIVGAAHPFIYSFGDPEHYYKARTPTMTNGIAVVDTATGIITDFHVLPRSPAGFVFDTTGRLVVNGLGGERRGKLRTFGVLSVIDLATGKVDSAVASTTDVGGFGLMMMRAGNRIYLYSQEDHLLKGYAGDMRKMESMFHAAFPSFLYGVAATGGKLYVSAYMKRRLMVYDENSPNPVDSLDLSAYADTGATGPGPVFAHGDYLYVVVGRLRSYSDSAAVAVIHAPTRTVQKVIPLHFHPSEGKVVGDALYFWYRGVEKIDLNTRTHAGIVVPEGIVGGSLIDFVPISPHSGYITYTDLNQEWRLRKVTF